MILTVLGRYGPYPAAGGACSGYLVSSRGKNVALDFGAGTLSRLQKYVSAFSLDAVALSHLHFDHMSDLLPLSYALTAAGKKLSLYLPDDDCPQLRLLRQAGCFNITEVSDGQTAEVGGFEFGFTQLTHPVTDLGMKISDGESSLFYSGDTIFDEKIISAAKGCGLLLLDACQPSGAASAAPHMSIAEGAFIGRAVGARTLLTHVHPAFSPGLEAAAFGAETAEELTRYKV